MRRLQRRLFPLAHKKIDRLIKSLGLACQGDLGEAILAKRHSYSTVCFKGNKKMFLKVRLWDRPVEKLLFEREILISRYLFVQDLSPLIFRKVLNFNTKKDPIWMLFEYLEGENLSIVESEAPLVAKALRALQAIDVKLLLADKRYARDRYWLKLNPGSKTPRQWFTQSFNLYIDDLKKIIPKHLRNNLRQFVQKNIIVIARAPLVFSHGDFDQRHIFKTKRNKIFLIDFADAQLNNQANDLANIYNRTYNHHQFRSRLVRDFSKGLTVEFKTLFRMTIIEQTLGKLHSFFTRDIPHSREDLEGVKDWMMTLQKAVRSFDSLVQ